MTTYFLTPNGSGFDGSGYTPDGTLPAGAIVCTQAQADNFRAYALSNGAIIDAPAAVLAAQALQAEVANALSAGLAITSTSTPAINGTYAVDQSAQTRINAIETAILKNGVFPGSSGTQMAYPDITGKLTVFPSTALFSEFATSVANYVADLDLYAAGAKGATLPSASVKIA